MVDEAVMASAAEAVRAISSTMKALRLYPPASPIPRESAASAVEALASLFDEVPVAAFEVVKGGFTFAGAPIERAASAADLADALQSHGIAEVAFVPGCDAESLMTFLAAVTRDPQEVRSEGGIGAILAAAGVESVSVSDVRLTVVDAPAPADEQDVDEFLRELAHDRDKLAAWLSAAVDTDITTLQESLVELARSVGAAGYSALAQGLSDAFREQDAEVRDRLLEVGMEPGPARDLLKDVLGRLGAEDIAQSVCGGIYGKNMLSLSTAMTSLPIEERFSAIMSQVNEMLEKYGHSPKEMEFLHHMVEVRRQGAPEAPLTQKVPDYSEMAEETELSDEEMEAVRSDLDRSAEWSQRRTVTTLLTLLDQQKDFSLYCQTLDSVAALAGRLIEGGHLELARKVVQELAAREARPDLTWPEVGNRLKEARLKAVDRVSVKQILETVSRSPDLASTAHDILASAGEAAAKQMLEVAVATPDGKYLEAAELILGRRIDDLLPAVAATAQWFQVATLARRFASAGDPRSMMAAERLASRSDEQSRREVARGLGQSGSPAVVPLLARLLADQSLEVAVAAAHGLVESGASGASHILAERLRALDVDGKDFPLAREVIRALGRIGDGEARDALSELAHRRSLLKRGHFVEVQELALKALQGEGGRG